MNKYTYIPPEESPLIILDRKSAVCMANNGKDTNHTRHTARRVNFIRNDEKWKLYKIEWCEGGLQLAYIVTENADDNYLNPRMKYIIVRIDNI